MSFMHILLLIQLANRISGYDNLSLRRPSTTLVAHPLYPPRLANDGDKRNSIYMALNSCAHTEDTVYHPTEAWWQVDLEAIYPIKTIEISYREGLLRRFAGFSIFVSNTSDFQNGVECFHHDSVDFPPPVKNWTCIATGRFVTIYNERNPSIEYPPGFSDNAILELCEVVVYGCPHNKFGPTCDSDCFCDEGTCDYETGVCPGKCDGKYTGEHCNECEDGYFGEGCLVECGQCMNDEPCNKVNGMCINGCSPGYIGDSCHQECEDGYFGEGCLVECGQCMNDEPCDKVNGMCINGCSPGYIGDNCHQEQEDVFY